MQSGRWCAQSLFENFTLQRLGAQIRTELRWTTAPRMDYTFHGRESTCYGGNLADACVLNRGHKDNYAARTLIGMYVCASWRPCGNSCVWNITIQEIKQIVLPCFGSRSTSQKPFSDKKRSHTHRQLQLPHRGTSALCCPSVFTPTQQHFSGGLDPGCNASRLSGAALFISPCLPPLSSVDMTCEAGNLITPVSKGEPGYSSQLRLLPQHTC